MSDGSEELRGALIAALESREGHRAIQTARALLAGSPAAPLSCAPALATVGGC